MMTSQAKNIQTFIIGVLSTLVVVLAGWVGYDKFLKPKSETIVTASVSEPAAASEPVIQASSEPLLVTQEKETIPTQKLEENTKGEYLGSGLYTSNMDSGKCLGSAKVTCGLFEMNKLPKEWENVVEATSEKNLEYWFSTTDPNKVTSIPHDWSGWQVMEYGEDNKKVMAFFDSAYTNTGECLLTQTVYDIKTKKEIDSVDLACN
ncbi:hypothetical protein OHV52_15660 [Acinetobacter baumannii]|nr:MULTISPECIES: hypothetical protein [Acinetobacter calcoaceticus/baumannii complex]MDC4283072.1 hypothetical protein [Acinetobacter baumannii]MDC4286513.1 hypothetical protein [Acinetobacter baumannii]MDC4289338.1 hypothetical protein [Acinetobacter baumannii]MDC4299636.1 hypothetical protein [Acinetobacter baumannii]MDC4320885.1 hypothetical protein [Acinetobacter baumannii]